MTQNTHTHKTRFKQNTNARLHKIILINQPFYFINKGPVHKQSMSTNQSKIICANSHMIALQKNKVYTTRTYVLEQFTIIYNIHNKITIRMYWISHHGLLFNMMLIQVYALTDASLRSFMVTFNLKTIKLASKVAAYASRLELHSQKL